MQVDPATPLRTDYQGRTYYFCAKGCLDRFRADPARYLEPAAAAPPADPNAVYTCPMHPEVRQQGPGACPICGMALEPAMVTLDEGPNVELIDMPLRYERLSEALRALQSRMEPVQASRRFVGQWGPMQRVNALIRQVAPFDSSALVLGESGSGKELVARTIHDCSPRRDKPFVALNTATLVLVSIAAVHFFFSSRRRHTRCRYVT